MSEKSKAGRPSSFKPEYSEQLIGHMASGYSFESFGGLIRKCKQTLYNWLIEQPEFLDAKNIGLTASQLWWEQRGQAGLFNAYQGDTINTGVWIFNMKNRFDWTDKREVSGSTEITVHKSKEQKEFIDSFKEQIEAVSNERKQS